MREFYIFLYDESFENHVCEKTKTEFEHWGYEILTICLEEKFSGIKSLM